MVWWSSASLIGVEGYKELSKPKKRTAAAFAIYSAPLFYVFLRHLRNPEYGYKNMLRPAAFVYCTVIPIALLYYGFSRSKQAKENIYKRTVGDMSDKELLELYFWFRTQK